MTTRKLDFSQYINDEGQLNLAGLNLTDQNLRPLCEFINQHHEIRSVNLNGDSSAKSNQITEMGCEYLSEALADNPNLVALHISNNDIGNNGVKYLSRLKQLTLLDIAATGIDENGIYPLKNLKRLISLDISDNLFGSIGVQALAAHCDQLKILYARNSNLRAEDAKAIAQMPNLLILVISDNQLGDGGAHYIASMKRLCFLDARRNNFSAVGEDIIDNMEFSSLNNAEKAKLEPSIHEHQTADKGATLGALALIKISHDKDLRKEKIQKNPAKEITDDE